MDVVRCRCPRDAQGARCGSDPRCAIHGLSPAHPIRPYVLTRADVTMLRHMRIAPRDEQAIAETRAADERRFFPPRP